MPPPEPVPYVRPSTVFDSKTARPALSFTRVRGGLCSRFPRFARVFYSGYLTMRLLGFNRLLGFARLLSAYTLTHRILGGVVDFANELLQHVFEEDHTEGGAVLIHNLRDMGSATLH